MQRVQRDRHRVHRPPPDRARGLRVPHLRGERRRQVGAELLHHAGQDLRGGGRREARVRQNSADQHQRAARQDLRARVRGNRETVAHCKVRNRFSTILNFITLGWQLSNCGFFFRKSKTIFSWS